MTIRPGLSLNTCHLLILSTDVCFQVQEKKNEADARRHGQNTEGKYVTVNQ